LSLFNELKRRNVFKVTIAYIVMAWLVMQVADVVLNNITVPGWIFHVLMLFLAIGLPFAVFFAWAFELTPEGLKREHEVDRTRSITPQTGKKLSLMITVVLILALGYFAYDKFVLSVGRETAVIESTVEQATPQVLTEQTVTAKAATESDKSIAVLPFINISDDESNEYFSEGLSEELLNQLVRIPELQVAARTSSFAFKGKDAKIAQIAKELNVSHVLEGSVRKAGNHVRITAQLIKADDGFQLWSETYDRTLDDIFVVQDDIANAVVNALKITLMGSMPKARQTDPEVYSLYLQGKYFDNLSGKENLEKALAAFEQALAIDPDYAPAWIGISIVHQNLRKRGLQTAEQAFALSMAAAERALVIDSNMAAAWASLAYLKKSRLDWAGARVALDRALILEPNNSFVIGTAASLAGNLGQLEASIELFERNVKLNPLGLSGLRALGIRYSDAERFDDALESFNRVIAINPDYPGIHINLGVTYLHKGDPETALMEIEKTPSWPIYAFYKARILSTLGNEVEAKAIINQLLETSAHLHPTAMAAVYAWRGENDLAFEWLEKAFQQEPELLAYFLRRPWNKGLETDSRYPVFLEKLGLLEAWKAIPPG